MDTTTTLAVDPRTSIRFDKRQHAPTVWLTVNSPADADLTVLDEHLAVAGWVRQPSLCPPMEPLPAKFRSAGEPDYATIEVAYHAVGTGLFGGHTVAEATAHKNAARAVLARFGFARIPTNTLRLQDML